MRQLLVQVAAGDGPRVLDLARTHDAVNVHRVTADGPDGPQDVVVLHVSNRRVERFLADLEERLPDAHVTLQPRGSLALQPPAHAAPQQLTHVEARSPVEIFLGGLQSVGTWTGMLGYAAAAGAVVWIGLTTAASYLLVAAMLIAPFAGPAMTAALATARGDARLLGRSLARYFASLGVTALVAGLLALATRQRMASDTMVDVTTISTTAILLPLVAGAAGALHLCLAERNSLVSGAAVGILVASSLAPPAGIVGMALVLREVTMLQAATFLLILQLTGIHLAGALVFRAYGLRSRGARYRRGRARVVAVAATVSLTILAVLLAWQLHTAPQLVRDTLAQEAAADARDAVRATGLAEPLDVQARFTGERAHGTQALLVTVHATRAPGVDEPADALREHLVEAVHARLAPEGALALVDVRMVEPPPAASTQRDAVEQQALGVAAAEPHHDGPLIAPQGRHDGIVATVHVAHLVAFGE